MKAIPYLVAVWLSIAQFACGQDHDSNRFKAIAILRQRCQPCHGPDLQESDFRVDSLESLRAGGSNDQPTMPSAGNDGEVLRRIRSAGDDRMPPEGDRLSLEQIELLENWLVNGASWPTNPSEQHIWPDDRLNHWAWQPLNPVALPADYQGNPIDFFFADQPAALNSVASPRSLIRRVYFDLVGLPPLPEDVLAFEQDSSAAAYSQIITRLLDSPRYGERWARHWLDVVHYADTHGYDKDQPRPNAWPYRDYVIRAFNEDKPFQRFIEEQIAGDVIYAGTRDGIEALGFLSAGPWDLIGHAEVPESKIDGKIARHLDRDDMVGTVLGSFCSITIQCAQCHDHKFDPFTQEDYYSLQSVFAAIDRSDRKYYRDESLQARFAELEREKLSLLRTIGLAGQATPSIQAESQNRAPEPDSIRELASSAEPDQASLAEAQNRLAKIDQELSRMPTPELVYCGCVHTGSGNFSGTGSKGGVPRPIQVLTRGNVAMPGEEVNPRGLAAIHALSTEFQLADDSPESQRRAALARWISSSQNPLTWRSIVNRAWQQHFGVGLVDSPNDFGKMGSAPVNLRLLDWLAADFRDHGGSLKRLHKLIVTSQLFRASSSSDWRRRKKLDAESIRDAILATSGKLDLTAGGPGFQDFVVEHPEHSPHYQYGLADPRDSKTFRRSIYRFIVRSQTQPMLTSLDCADPSVRVGKRNESTTPLQSLTMLNDRFVLVQAEYFAERLAQEEATTELQIQRAFWLALSRPATEVELKWSLEFVAESSLAAFCRAILNSNEFLFVD